MRCRIDLAVLVVTGSLIAPRPSSAQPFGEAPILALLTNVRGGVEVVMADGRRRPAHDFQAVTEGQQLKLVEHASVTYVCTNGRIRRQTASFEVTPEMCSSTSRPAEPSTELVLNFGRLELVGEARGDRQGFDRKPFILSPRCPADLGSRRGCHRLLAPPPTVRWLAVAHAEGYHLEFTGPRHYPRVTVKSSELDCAESGTFKRRRVCSLGWPTDSWPLEPGRGYEFEVIAVRGTKWTHSGEMRLQPLAESEAHGLRSLVGSAHHPAVRAAIFLGAGLFQEASRELEAVPASVGRDLALGEVYLRLDLPELARGVYLRALKTARSEFERWRSERGLKRARQ